MLSAQGGWPAYEVRNRILLLNGEILIPELNP